MQNAKNEEKNEAQEAPKSQEIIAIPHKDGGHIITIWCEGCQETHSVRAEKGKTWSWGGSSYQPRSWPFHKSWPAWYVHPLRMAWLDLQRWRGKEPRSQVIRVSEWNRKVDRHNSLVQKWKNQPWSWSYSKDGKICLSPSLCFGDRKLGTNCHSWVHDGRITYIGDTNHILRNRTVKLRNVMKAVKENAKLRGNGA